MTTRFALALILATALPALAQETTGHDGHMMGDKGPASMAFMEANTRMHEDMAIEYTGNADVDFIRGMIPHHQGAVDMAKIVLEHGADPEVRKLAEGVIAAQEAEIKWMEEWLAKNGG
ncbi:CopM family metallochaperone [Tabrizicola sp.]|uniref:CopM family metallochaperone n=1 Tax=Tabrizicola sp. TaxID=2005166 RepID=UPI003F3140D9